MKKIIGLMLLICFSVNTFAASNLETIIDDFQYTMSVEWDQKDMKFHEAQTRIFIEKLAASGATNEELLTLVENKTQDKKMLEAIKLKLKLSPIESKDELARILSENSKAFYSKGASWNGDAVSAIGVAAVVIILGYVIYHAVAYKCVETDYRFQCTGHPADGNQRCYWGDVCVKSEKR